MKRLTTILLLAGWALAMAQSPPEQEAAPAGQEATGPCVTEEEAELLEDGTDFEICDEEAEAVEADAEEEFTPGDEISEDYPIPLPADI